MSQAIETARSEQVADLLVSLVHAEGSATHPYPQATELTAGPEAMRNLADAAHYLCVLHGRFPGVIDHAAAKTSHPAALGPSAEERQRWLSA